VILVDSSVLIDFFKGAHHKKTQAFRTILQRSIPFGINSFIYQEVLQGAKTQKEYRLLKRYLEVQRFYHPKDPVDSFGGAAKIYFDCRKKGVTIRSTIDCIVAQIAIEHDLLLLHNDSDFDAIAKLVPLKIYQL
jgi:predicted nucleic acid-binding protein